MFHSIDDDRKVAVALHRATCCENHTDGCAWMYEIRKNDEHDWTGNSHSEYFNKANKLLGHSSMRSVEDVLIVLNALGEQTYLGKKENWCHKFP